MELLDRANTGAFGQPVPTSVNTDIKKGPFIVVSGHDLEDMHQLLEQTKDKEQKAPDTEREIIYSPMVAEPQEYKYNADAFAARKTSEAKQETAGKELPKVREDKAR